MTPEIVECARLIEEAAVLARRGGFPSREHLQRIAAFGSVMIEEAMRVLDLADELEARRRRENEADA